MTKRLGLNVYVVNMAALVALFHFSNSWSSARYGEMLCNDPSYRCLRVKGGESWVRLFPDEADRELVKRVNRMNVFLRSGMLIAVPRAIATATLFDVSPFALNVKSRGEKVIDVDLKTMAWGAYDNDGHLVKWGPISTGVASCPDVVEGCSTPTGVFRVISKQGEECVSSAFPQRLNGEVGGAAMPYCIHFYKGYALHGSDELTGRASSHGCVNLFKKDAQWLNQQFVDTPKRGHKGTLIMIRSKV